MITNFERTPDLDSVVAIFILKRRDNFHKTASELTICEIRWQYNKCKQSIIGYRIMILPQARSESMKRVIDFF